MNKIWDSDEWKRADNAHRAGTPRTRAQEQEYIDTEYANGRMTKEEWNRRFDELGNLEKWCGKGRL